MSDRNENADSTNSTRNMDSNEAQCKIIDDNCSSNNVTYEADTSTKRVNKIKADSSSSNTFKPCTSGTPTASTSLSASSSSTSSSSTAAKAAATYLSTNYSITPPPSPEGKRQKLMADEGQTKLSNKPETSTSSSSSSSFTTLSINPSTSTAQATPNEQPINVNLPGMSSSPPRFVTIEEIMKAANGMSNMYLAHEIAMNKNFRLEKRKTSGLKKEVEQIMKQAFWDILQSQLNESPPVFKQALVIMEEIKEILLSFLPPRGCGIKKELEEIIDIPLIRQQAENGALDFQRYAQYILSVMARLCAPCRDERIRILTETREIVPLFSGIMDLLEVMKLDMANYAIDQARPVILQQSIEYEKQKFKEYLKAHSKIANEDSLEMSKRWLRETMEDLDLSDENNFKLKLSKILSHAFTQLISWNKDMIGYYPETMLMDESRVKEIAGKIEHIIRVGSVLLVTYANIGPNFQENNELRELLKTRLLIILEYDDKDDDDVAKNKFEMAYEQIVNTIKEYTSEREINFEFSEEKLASMKKQITDVNNITNRIRQIVERRIIEFIESVLISNSMASLKMPSGLSAFQNDLTVIAGQYLRLYSHNRSVFGEYYQNIITELLLENE